MRHPEQALFGFVRVGNEPLSEECRGSWHVGQALGEEPPCAALCEGQGGAPRQEQASDRAFEGLLIIAEVVVAEAGDDLFFDRRYLVLPLLLGGGPGGDTETHPALARQWCDRGVCCVEELLDLLRERGLPDTGEVEGLGDDGA